MIGIKKISVRNLRKKKIFKIENLEQLLEELYSAVATRPGNLENQELSGNSNQPGTVMDFFRVSENLKTFNSFFSTRKIKNKL